MRYLLAIVAALISAPVKADVLSFGALLQAPLDSEIHAICWSDCDMEQSPVHPYIRYQSEHWSATYSQPMRSIAVGISRGNFWSGPGVYEMRIDNPVGFGTLRSVGIGWQMYYTRGSFAAGIHFPPEERYTEIGHKGAGVAELQRIMVTIGVTIGGLE